MTDKVQKIREDVEKLKSQLLRGACSSQIAMETRCKEEAYDEVLALLNTMQKEPVGEEKLSNVQRTVKNRTMREEIYHILIKKECSHNCPLCCNRLYDIEKLPTITGEQLREAHTVCLTGGEPFMMDSWDLIHLCRGIRTQYPNIQKLYIYSSGYGFESFSLDHWLKLINSIDGLNVSPKNEYEWEVLRRLHKYRYWAEYMSDPKLSNRLYVFDDQWHEWEKINGEVHLSENWQIIGRKWDAEFKTPENEHFVRLPILF